MTVFRGPSVRSKKTTPPLGTADSMIEWRYTDLSAHIYGDAVQPRDGRIQIPQGPGLGADPDPDVLRRYLDD